MNQIKKSKKECPLVDVTVYKDRAQITRSLEMTVEAGVHELHITDFVDIIEDSLRVEGKGNATIAEVSFNSESATEVEASREGKEKELEDELLVLRKELEDKEIETKKESNTKQQALLDTLFSKAAESGINLDKEGKSTQSMSEDYLGGIKYFMTSFKDMNEVLLKEKRELRKEEEETTNKIQNIATKLAELRGSRNIFNKHNRNRMCIVVLEAAKETKIEMTISYVVNAAYWVPSYDLRMLTEEGKLKLFYYGLISQNSGEDWNDVKIFLSTAEPSCGRSIPDIPVTELSIQPKITILPQGFPMSRAINEPRRMYSPMVCNDPPMAFGMACDSPVMEDDLSEMSVTEIKVVDKTTSISYEIARQSTIPSDNNQHKVTVALVDYQPELSYVTIPKASPNAFLRAKLTNTSPYFLLRGQSSIFLDNSFICKADFESVTPNEEFTCSLGVDPSVRVTYKPINKMKSTSGLMSKVSVTKYEQAIVVKNLHSSTIKVVVQEGLPKSTNEKIKVTMQSPVIDTKHPEKSTDVHFIKNNIVEWNVDIASMATKELMMKYTVETPVNEQIRSDTQYYSSDASSLN